MKDQAEIVGSLTSRAQSVPAAGTGPSPLSGHTTTTATTGASTLSAPSGGSGGSGGDGSVLTASSSPDSRHVSRAEQERLRATEDISQRCVKLLRKTRLQVQVVIEVIHCKSPKHLITEVVSSKLPPISPWIDRD